MFGNFYLKKKWLKKKIFLYYRFGTTKCLGIKQKERGAKLNKKKSILFANYQPVSRTTLTSVNEMFNSML